MCFTHYVKSIVNKVIIMAIDPNSVLEEVKYYLPIENVFTDAQMLTAINKVISIVGSDDSFYEEVTCKSTKRIAEDNAAKSSTVSSHKKIVTENLSEEFFQGDNINIKSQIVKDNMTKLKILARQLLKKTTLFNHKWDKSWSR